MTINTSLFKQNVRVTQAYKGVDHKGLDLSTGVAEQPVYLPIRAVEGYVWKILSGYSYGGKYYANSPIIYIKHKDGSGSRYIHSYTKNVKVKVGDTVKAGQEICSTGNSGYSKGDHVHFEWLTKWDDLKSHTDPLPYLISEEVQMYNLGDIVSFSDVQNVRKGSGTNFEVISQTKVGQIATIKDGPRVANGYSWFDMEFENGSSGWVADVGKFDVATGSVVPPEQSEWEKKYNEAMADNLRLKIELGASEGREVLLREEIKNLKIVIEEQDTTIGICKDDLADMSIACEFIREERDRYEADKLALELKLSAMRNGGLLEGIVRIIRDLLGKIKF